MLFNHSITLLFDPKATAPPPLRQGTIAGMEICTKCHRTAARVKYRSMWAHVCVRAVCVRAVCVYVCVVCVCVYVCVRVNV